MFTKAFNCPLCDRPFEWELEELRPVYSQKYKQICCFECDPASNNALQRGLMDFLGLDEFEWTAEGYTYTLPIAEPHCAVCEGPLLVNEWIGVPAGCGHYVCEYCDERRTGAGCVFCVECDAVIIDATVYSVDRAMVAFWQLVKLDSAQTEIETLKIVLNNQVSENEKLKTQLSQIPTVDKQEDQSKELEMVCSDCGLIRSVERLYKCQNCSTINCGNCAFDSHHDHAVAKLLGIELYELQQQSDKRYTDIVEGFQGNLQYVEKNINDAVEKVLLTGKDRLTQIMNCVKYGDGRKIVEKVDKAAADFEKEFELYVPVARQFATRLAEIDEELAKGREDQK